MKAKQDARELAWSWIYYGAWGAALLIAYLRLSNHIGSAWGVTTIILCMGVAVTAAIRLSRMRLTETMLAVYRAGIESAKAQAEERAEMERRIREASKEG